MTVAAHDVTMPARTARLPRAIVCALAVKGLLLLAIYMIFFSPTAQPPSDASATADALIGAAERGDSR